MRTLSRFNAPFAIALLAVAVLVAGSAGAEYKPIPLGSALPSFSLKDQNGAEHSPAAYDGKIIVLDFSSIECPYSRGVDPGLEELVKAYGPKGVVFLGVDSHKSVTPEQILKYTTESKLGYPVLKDAGNAYADALGASRTPEFYVFGKNHKLAYHGAFDNRKAPDQKGDTGYVKDAVEDLLAGRPVKTPQADAWGCSIKRAK